METRLSGLRHGLGEVELVWVLFSGCRANGKEDTTEALSSYLGGLNGVGACSWPLPESVGMMGHVNSDVQQGGW